MVEYKEKWYKYCLQQCTVTYSKYFSAERIRDDFWLSMECSNLVLSPQFSNNSIYTNRKYGCCINHLKNMRRYFIESEKFNCRACYKCVDIFWKQTSDHDLFEWDTQQCRLESSIWKKKYSDIKRGNQKLFDYLNNNMGMNLTIHHLKRKDGKVKYSRPNKFHRARLQHRSKSLFS